MSSCDEFEDCVEEQIENQGSEGEIKSNQIEEEKHQEEGKFDHYLN